MKTKNLLLCAIFTALSAVFSQIMIPMVPVPINLTHVSVFVSAGLLGKKYGTISQLFFVLLGAIGVPVFSGFSGGISRILGPTGGFILGYIACAYITGTMIERLGKSGKILIPAMISGMIVTYVLGILWFMYIAKTGFITALLACVVPFLLGDALKITASAVIVSRVSSVLKIKIGAGY